MMENTLVIHAEGTNTSLLNQDGKSRQLSEQAAALLSSMKIESLSLENSETILILMMLLQSITTNTTNGDVVVLSIYRTKDVCEQLGIDESVVREVLNRFLNLSKILRSKNPLAF